jgi:hydroxymethylbilane synthase
LHIETIRGNVDTRIRKTLEGQYDAIVLAAAGIVRLGLQDHISQYLPLEIMLPAPGQGALAVQCREDDEHTLLLLSAIENSTTRRAVNTERAFLSALGGGCSLPVGAMAEVKNEEIILHGVIAAPDGSRILRVTASGIDPLQVGQDLAKQAFDLGARTVLPQDAFENKS